MPCGASGGGGVFRRAVVWCRCWCGRLPGAAPPDPLSALRASSSSAGRAGSDPGQAGNAPDWLRTAPGGPGTAPDEPGVESDRLIAAPDGPGEAPDRPGTPPDWPGEPPDRPGEAPDRPGEAPDGLVTAPDGPGEPPDRLGTPPDGLGTAPDEPEAAGWGRPGRGVASPRLGGTGLYCRPTWSSSLPTLRPRSSSSARSLVVRSAKDRGGASPDGTETMSPERRWRGPWV